LTLRILERIVLPRWVEHLDREAARMAVGRKSGLKLAPPRSKVTARASPAAAAPAEVDPAFHRAILKIALELKKPTALRYDQVVDATIRSMRLDAAAFRRYLGENGARNMGLLLATARGGGL
jgi:hypothetical protein